MYRWKDNEKEYLRYIVEGKSYKEILKLMNDKFDNKFEVNQIKSAIQRYKLNTGRTGQFEKGSNPWNKDTVGIMKSNKTSFRKGNTPNNHRPVGSERVDIEGYTYIKIEEPKKWVLKHRYIYEKHNIIPKGYVVIFADGNKSNFNIENLITVKRSELLTLNKEGLIDNDSEITKVGVNVARLINKTNAKRKG
ncbi:MAG: HNH endonuclease signature motif containing protein [Paraclostridium sp.]